MQVLVTGSSGWLARALIPRLLARGHGVVGVDPAPSPRTQVVGSIADRGLVRATTRDHGIDAVVHAGALHKPHVATHARTEFLAVNVQGTLNLLEEATAPGAKVERFVFTSTTSLMISSTIHAGRMNQAVWIDENLAPLEPRNIYGVTKLAAEHLCRLVHEQHGLPLLILRTARFFPEADDRAHAIAQNDANTKVNELLFRRLTVDDAADCHILALERAPELGFDTFIVAAPTPFSPADCPALLAEAPAVVARYFPRYEAVYRRLGWTMFDSIDRVYDASKLRRRLGFVCRTDFAAKLEELAGTLPPT